MKKLLMAILLGIIGVITSISDAHALENDSTLTTSYIDNVYAYHYKNGVLRSYGKLPFRYQNGSLVYCIEPDRVINHTTYNSTNDWSITGYSEDVKKQMELIAHFGYEYPNHNTIRYYMATQELIWLYSDDYVKWMDTYSTNGSVGNQINVENEKNEILSLIDKYNLYPSFASQSYNGYFGDKLELIDTNNVLNNYAYRCGINYTSNSNVATFVLNKFGNNKITYIKGYNAGFTTVYYHNLDSQMMASLKLRDSKEISMNIVVDKVRVRINKKDLNTKNLINKEGAVFKIKNINNNTYITEELKTNKEGYAYIDLTNGKYEIEEVKAPKGYVINKESIQIDINDNITLNDKYYDVDIYNDKPKGKISINKKDEDGNALNGVLIGLFDKNHNKISSITTKENNYFDNLELGTYYVKELDTLEGYILDEKEYKINLSYKNDKTYVVEKTLDIVNKKIKCDIVYISKESLKDIQISLFDENNKIVFEGKTNEEGKITISNLPYGKYYIKQIKVPKGYILNEEEYIFYVNDSTCFSNIEVHNEKTTMPITSTSINKSICFVISLSLIGVYNLVKKNN